MNDKELRRELDEQKSGWNALVGQMRGIDEKVDALYNKLGLVFVEFTDNSSVFGLSSSRAIEKSAFDNKKKNNYAAKTPD